MLSDIDAESAGFEIFPWSRNFETGHDEIDKQHKMLVEILNRLAWHFASSTSVVDCARILDELIDYTEFHFDAEEAIWLKVLGDNDAVRDHHAGHQLFFEQIEMFRSSGGPESEVLAELFDYLTRWLAFHILEADRRMILIARAVEQGESFMNACAQADRKLNGAVPVMVSALLECFGKLSSSTLQLMREKMIRLKVEDELSQLQRKQLREELEEQATSHQQQLEFLAYSDPTTGLLNRNGIAKAVRDMLDLYRQQAGSAALISIDLDGFQAINARFGEESADQLLGLLARRWLDTLACNDKLARISGDEFVVLVTDGEMVETQLAALRLTAAQPFSLGGHDVPVSFTAGVVLFLHSSESDADTLLRQANHTLFRAKQEAKGSWLYLDAAEQRRYLVRQQLLSELRLALANNEFRLVYQPKVNLCTGMVVGVEALIRWQHPDKGLLSPARFLPAIEHHPLIIDIGEWVVEQALKQMARWDKEGLVLDVAVNIAAIHLQHPGFVTKLAGLLARYPDIAPERLDLEILETAALGELDKATDVIRGCEKLGVTFSLDDFGTGYSSLSYLKQLPVQTLKIDQGFVRGALTNDGDMSILKGIIGLSRAFGRKLVAEGVETREHGDLLIKLGCDYAQGFAIARPMSPERMGKWTAQWQQHTNWSDKIYAKP
jgi:hemerythrin-like metal-binding protein/diguanylate cyclase (GGDEF)-like protein